MCLISQTLNETKAWIGRWKDDRRHGTTEPELLTLFREAYEWDRHPCGIHHCSRSRHLPATTINHKQVRKAPRTRFRLALALVTPEARSSKSPRERLSMSGKIILTNHALDAETTILFGRQLSLNCNGE
jgi:type VI protein secretion system component VasA